jgi:DNA-binding MarR family transcriptional regulator
MRIKSSKPDRRLIFLLNAAQRRLQRHFAEQVGVTTSQGGVLFVLGTRDGTLMGEAGAALELGMPGMSGLAERMVDAGLIDKRADPEDGRASRLWLTPAGRAALARIKIHVAELNVRLMQGFNDAEIGTVARWLAHVAASFPKGEEE